MILNALKKLYLKGWHLGDVIAGAISGFLLIIFSTAFAALIFKGHLTNFLSIGISCALIGGCLINFITATTSAFPFANARVDPVPAAILGLIFANIVGLKLPEVQLLPTLLATLALATLLTGASMFFLGYFKMGHIIRFLPYPVLGGVIAGVGWVMAHASLLLIMNGETLSIETLKTAEMLKHAILGLGFALFLYSMPRNKWWPSILLCSLIVITMATNLVLTLNHISHTEAIQMGWLFSSFKPTFVVTHINHSMIQQVNWTVILNQTGYLLSFIVIVMMNTLLNVNSLEALTNTKANIDHELKLTGLANVLSGLFLGTSANLSLSGTLIHQQAGAKTRISGVLTSLLALTIVLIYPETITYIPKPIIGGFLLFIALGLWDEWLYQGWKKFPTVDYVIILSILMMVALQGFLPGVVFGIIIVCIVFIIRYARLDAIQFSTTGKTYHSNVLRPIYQQKWLSEKGKNIQIFKLHGYLFFGSAKLLLEKINQLLEHNTDQEIKFLVFDFHLVNGIDTSAIFSFARLAQLVSGTDLQIIFTGCSVVLKTQLKRQGIINDSIPIFLFPDLDQGLEWCENQSLATLPEQLKSPTSAILDTLSQLIPDQKQQAVFTRYLTKFDIPADYILIKQGTPSDCLYFIESGNVSIFIEENGSNPLRLSKSGPGTIVGELGFYLHQKRTATVRSDTSCVVYSLTEQHLSDLESTYPEIALIFYRSIVHILALRVVQTNYELQMISR